MLIRPAFLLIISINVKSDSGKRIRIPLPIPLALLLSLTLSAEELLDLALLFTRNKRREKLRRLKFAAMALRFFMMEMMFSVGPYDYVYIDAGDGEDRARIRIHTK